MSLRDRYMWMVETAVCNLLKSLLIEHVLSNEAIQGKGTAE